MHGLHFVFTVCYAAITFVEDQPTCLTSEYSCVDVFVESGRPEGGRERGEEGKEGREGGR